MNTIFTLILMFLFMFNYFAQQDSNNTITALELKGRLGNDSSLIVLDVRNPYELKGNLGQIDDVINIPVQELENRITEMEKYRGKEIAVICRTGNRSHFATEFLIAEGFKAKNVLGGMVEYRTLEK
jgi:rhodanese-related sulfurtransferase